MNPANKSQQFTRPKYLTRGDKVCILTPAKSIDAESISIGVEILKSWGLVVEVGEYAEGNYKFFSGTDDQRASDFRKALDNPEIKAIICSRGGYGSMRTLNKLGDIDVNKWIVGYSDITIFHSYCNIKGVESIHGSMPINFKDADKISLEGLRKALFGELNSHIFKMNDLDRIGIASGKLVGGNLSVLYSMLGTPYEIDFKDTILFLEDVGEDFYSVDRMLTSFIASKKLKGIKGIVVGYFNNCTDTENMYKCSINELIVSILSQLNVPIAFNFPAGHIEPNVAMYMGRKVELIVKEDETKLIYY